MGTIIVSANKIYSNNFSNITLHCFYICCALLFLNRMDYVLILFPLVLYITFFKIGFLKSFKFSYIGIFIILSWFIFAVIYFGFPFPNTYYSKTNFDYGEGVLNIANHFAMYMKGFVYLVYTGFYDPITIMLIILGLILGFNSNILGKMLSVGILSYIVYIFTIGGDFMMGRFFTLPFYISIFNIISFFAYKKKISSILSYSIVLLILIGIPFEKQYIFYTQPQGKYLGRITNKVVGSLDEKQHYSYGINFNLLNQHSLRDIQKILELNIRYHSFPKITSIACGGVGKKLFISNNSFVIDSCALTDVFLAQMPFKLDLFKVPRRIGHFSRNIPKGYPEFLLSGSKDISLLEDEKLRPLLADVTLAISGDIFTWERFKAIYRLNISKSYYK